MGLPTFSAHVMVMNAATHIGDGVHTEDARDEVTPCISGEDTKWPIHVGSEAPARSVIARDGGHFLVLEDLSNRCVDLVGDAGYEQIADENVGEGLQALLPVPIRHNLFERLRRVHVTTLRHAGSAWASASGTTAVPVHFHFSGRWGRLSRTRR